MCEISCSCVVDAKNIKLNMEADECERLAAIYKLFGNVARLKILLRLADGECEASELAKASELSQSATSHQLKDLKNCRIIKSRKQGLYVYYSLDDLHILKLLQIGIEHVRGEHCYE